MMNYFGNIRKPVIPARPRFAPHFGATLRNRARRYFSRGQSAVELALVVPALVLVLVIAADFSRVFYMSIEAANAARAGVQYGAQSTTKASDTAGMQQAALNDAPNLGALTATASNFCECPPSTSHVTCSSTTCSGMEMYVQVNTSAQFQTLVHYPGVPSTVTLNESALMRAE
jgi:Flp pilus assembly protein TadG